MRLAEYLQQHYSPTALASYQNMIDQFLFFIGDQAAPMAIRANYQDILDYMHYLRKQNKHPKTLKNHLYAIKIYYRWLVHTGQRDDHPCQYLYLQDKVNRAIPLEDLYRPDQLHELLSNYPSSFPHWHRNKVILSLLVHQALTTLELTRLEVKHINLERATITLEPTVNTQGRTLPLQGAQIFLLHTYLTTTRPALCEGSPASPLLFLTVRGQPLRVDGVTRTLNVLGIKPLPFKIRQSVIAHLLKQGHDLRVVQVFAGHRRSASTAAYRQTGLEELKASINKLHPLQ
ncbi:MAG: tyrosine-type recombinase/integrase [Bacteroidota bacterium]